MHALAVNYFTIILHQIIPKNEAIGNNFKNIF